MKTKKISIGIVLFIAFCIVLGFTPSKVRAQRGKVVTPDRSELNSKDYNFIKASFSPFQQDNDSTEIISGEICILKENGETEKTLPFQPRRFPNWFEFGCEDAGDFIDYRIVANGTRAIITGFPPRN